MDCSWIGRLAWYLPGARGPKIRAPGRHLEVQKPWPWKVIFEPQTRPPPKICWLIGWSSGWWFGTWLLFFHVCINILGFGNNHPNWLSYFSEGLKPPTRWFCLIFSYMLLHVYSDFLEMIQAYLLCSTTKEFKPELGQNHCRGIGDIRLRPGTTSRRC